jgi:tetratricopeptide (TPR) repeat protein
MKKCIFSVLAIVTMHSAIGQTQQDAIVKTMNERYEAASADFKTLIKATPTNGDLYFYAGENYLLWGELDSAQTMYSKGTEVAAINPLNFVGLGRVARLKGDEAKGELMFTKAVDVMCLKSNKVPKPTQQESYIRMADSYTHVAPKNLDKALAHLTTATKFNAENSELYIQLGDYYAEKDGFNLSNALSQYNKALEVNPKYTPALLRKGVRYVGFENYDEGLKYYNEAIASDPTFAPAYREKAELLYKAGRYTAAVDS